MRTSVGFGARDQGAGLSMEKEQHESQYFRGLLKQAPE